MSIDDLAEVLLVNLLVTIVVVDGEHTESRRAAGKKNICLSETLDLEQSS